MDETKPPHGDNQNFRQPIRYQDITSELSTGESLRHFYGNPEQTEWDLRHLGIDEKNIQLLMQDNSPGKTFSHLVRLMARGGAEKAFAVAWLEHAPVEKQGDQAEAINDVIATEGVDTTMFWTFAPYLFQALTEKNIAADQALAMISNWSKTGQSTYTHKEVGRCNDDWTKTHLKGLEFISESGGHYQYILDKDAKHVSHSFTAQEARRIADMLISELDEK